jgi:hypothetical protein
MKRVFTFLVLFSIIFAVVSQTTNLFSTGTSIAQTFVADKQQWNQAVNPANIGYSTFVQTSINYQNRFLLSQLATKSVSVIFPLSEINVASGLSYYGYSQYHEMLLSIGAGKSFSGHFALGLQADYQCVFNPALGAYVGAFFIQSGTTINLSKSFNLSISVFNPTQNKIKLQSIDLSIPTVYSIGTAWQLTPEFVWRTQVDKEASTYYRFATGADYKLIQTICLKIGIYKIDTFVPCMGIRLEVSKMIIDLDTEVHPQLGINVIGGLRFNINNKVTNKS